MMGLTYRDVLTVIAIAAVWTIAVSVLALAAIRLGRRASITAQFAVVVLTAPVAIAGSVIVIAAEMYVSHHDLQVLIWVVAISSAMSVLAAVAVGRIARTSMSTLRDTARRVGDGEIVSIEAGASREISEVSAQLADTSARLAEARAEIERLDASRRQFFAWISHDLRTPLTGIRALAEGLEEGVADKPVEYLRGIRTQTDTMNRLVDDLFELSRLRSGALVLRCESVELLDIVSDAVADVAHLSRARGITITQADIAGHMVWADAHELTRVVVNLLTNSVKHAPADSEILVSADCVEDGHLTLYVLDHGDGVATEDLGRIFEVGWRSERARTPHDSGAGASAGAGLGLAIVHEIVRAHGGEVSAENVDDGFRLAVALPTLRASPSP